jgi:hypothetical protein
MHLTELRKIEAAGGLVLQRYAELTAAADGSAHGSPAAEAKAEFERDFVADAAALQRRLEVKAAASTTET